jgi:hypothetical protein
MMGFSLNWGMRLEEAKKIYYLASFFIGKG